MRKILLPKISYRKSKLIFSPSDWSCQIVELPKCTLAQSWTRLIKGNQDFLLLNINKLKLFCRFYFWRILKFVIWKKPRLQFSVKFLFLFIFLCRKKSFFRNSFAQKMFWNFQKKKNFGGQRKFIFEKNIDFIFQLVVVVETKNLL